MRWSCENLFSAIQQSKSVSDVCKALGITSSASNYKTFYKYKEMYNLDTSHFDPSINRRRVMKEYRAQHTLSDEQVFVENSTYPQSPLRKRVRSKDLIPYECGVCGLGDTWNGISISLQLDHINGVNNDHRLTNLRWLCPNCHSQTSTYVGRNKSS